MAVLSTFTSRRLVNTAIHPYASLMHRDQVTGYDPVIFMDGASLLSSKWRVLSVRALYCLRLRINEAKRGNDAPLSFIYFF